MDEKKETLIEMQNLIRSFAFLDKRIRLCHLWSKGKTEEREKLQKQREVFLQMANELDFHDLKVVYYVRALSKRRNIFSALRVLYQAECVWKNTAQQTDEYKDPFD